MMATWWNSLHQPAWLWLWPVLVAIMYYWRARLLVSVREHIQWVHPHIDNVARLQRISSSHAYILILYVVAVSCFVIALARPQTVGEPVMLPPQGREFVLLVDTSQSMGVSDFNYQDKPVRRVDVLKAVVSDFILQRKHDHFSLIAFSSTAATLVPMTFDRQLVIEQLQRLQLGLLGDDTSIGLALALAVKQTGRHSESAPVFILFSDGENTAGEVTPRDALLLTRSHGAHIYSVAITGADETVPATIIEPGLQDLARYSGGRFYHASSSESLRDMIADVDKLERTIQTSSSEVDTREWYAHWIMAGILAMLLTHALHGWRERA